MPGALYIIFYHLDAKGGGPDVGGEELDDPDVKRVPGRDRDPGKYAGEGDDAVGVRDPEHREDRAA